MYIVLSYVIFGRTFSKGIAQIAKFRFLWSHCRHLGNRTKLSTFWNTNKLKLIQRQRLEPSMDTIFQIQHSVSITYIHRYINSDTALGIIWIVCSVQWVALKKVFFRRVKNCCVDNKTILQSCFECLQKQRRCCLETNIMEQKSNAAIFFSGMFTIWFFELLGSGWIF
jgi:hypothetical protein